MTALWWLIPSALVSGVGLVVLCLCRAAGMARPLSVESSCVRCRMNGGPEFPTCLLCGASEETDQGFSGTDEAKAAGVRECDHGVSLTVDCAECESGRYETRGIH